MSKVPVRDILSRFVRMVDGKPQRLTQGEIAARLNVTQPAVANWVADDEIPPARHAQLLALAEALNIPLRYAELVGRASAA